MDFFLTLLFLLQIYQSVMLSKICDKLRIETHLIKKGFKLMALDFSALTTAVQNDVTVEAGVVTTLTAIEAEITKLAANQQDPTAQAQLDALAKQLGDSTTALSAAVAAIPPADLGTPATPASNVPAGGTPVGSGHDSTTPPTTTL